MDLYCQVPAEFTGYGPFQRGQNLIDAEGYLHLKLFSGKYLRTRYIGHQFGDSFIFMADEYSFRNPTDDCIQKPMGVRPHRVHASVDPGISSIYAIKQEDRHMVQCIFRLTPKFPNPELQSNEHQDTPINSQIYGPALAAFALVQAHAPADGDWERYLRTGRVLDPKEAPLVNQWKELRRGTASIEVSDKPK